MKLWLISQTANTGWDTYDSAVVAAPTEDAAAMIHPSEYRESIAEEESAYGSWVGDPELVTVEYLGEAEPGTEPGVICASFNAG